MKLIILKETINILSAMASSGDENAVETLKRYNAMNIEERQHYYLLTEKDVEN